MSKRTRQNFNPTDCDSLANLARDSLNHKYTPEREKRELSELFPDRKELSVRNKYDKIKGLEAIKMFHELSELQKSPPRRSKRIQDYRVDAVSEAERCEKEIEDYEKELEELDDNYHKKREKLQKKIEETKMKREKYIKFLNDTNY